MHNRRIASFKRRGVFEGGLQLPSTFLISRSFGVPALGKILILNLFLFDLAPPGLVVHVPANGGFERVFEVVAGGPAECLRALAVEGVSNIVARPIRDVLNQRLRLPEHREDRFRDLDIRSLVPAAHVIGISRFALVQNRVDTFAVIHHVDPVPDLLPIAVDGEFLALKGVGDEEWDQLLRVLVRAVVVGAPRDQNGNFVRDEI